MENKKVHIIGGGTVSFIRSHLALCAPAYGDTARDLSMICQQHDKKLDVVLHLTRMAGGDRDWSTSDQRYLETNEDIKNLLENLVADPATKIIFLNAALVDFDGQVPRESYYRPEDRKTAPRLSSREGELHVLMTPAEKLVGMIRQNRKDIFLVAFKQTCGATEDEQYLAGLNLLKSASCNAVLANDTKTRVNMIIVPEEARYCVTKDREHALEQLVELVYLRSHLTFTRSTVVKGDRIPWESELVYPSLRAVVNHCIEAGAYKPFRGSTAGHFACKLDETTFLTSVRKTDFNDLKKNGLVKVVTDGPDSVIAYGAKPSVGGQSQRIVFTDHPDYDCIVHFHCPKKEGSKVPTISQFEYECGSHECGRNTSKGLAKFGNLSAVYLDEHGPNIVFNHGIDPQEVVAFIDDNFDLSDKTGGYVSLGTILKTPDTLADLRAITGG